MKRILFLLLIAATPALPQFGNATRIQGNSVKSPLNCSNGYVLTWVTANLRFECLAGGGGAGNPGGSSTQLQYNNAGSFGGTTGLTWDGSVLTMPDGTISAPSLQWTHTGSGKLGFYKLDNTTLGFPDQTMSFINSGDTRFFLRLQQNNIDIVQQLASSFDLTFYNASGVGSGHVVALLSDSNLLFGPFSGGALNTGIVRDGADGILNVANAGLTLQPIKFATQSPGDNSTKGATTAFVTAAVAIPAQYKTLSCQPGLGDGLNAMAAGTYLQSICWNKTGVTMTLTSVQCFTDNVGTSTMNVTNGAGTALLTGAITCSSTIASGTQGATTTIANNDFLKFTFVADGTSKQTTWVVAATY